MDVNVYHRKRVRGQGEFDCRLFSRLEGPALEAAQFLQRPGYGRDWLMNVQRCHLVSLARSGVSYVHGDFRGCAGSDLERIDLQILKLECRIAQAVSERKERRAAVLQVTSVARCLVVVEIEQLPYRLW